jgi:hypothetical protein
MTIRARKGRRTRQELGIGQGFLLLERCRLSGMSREILLASVVNVGAEYMITVRILVLL